MENDKLTSESFPIVDISKLTHEDKIFNLIYEQNEKTLKDQRSISMNDISNKLPDITSEKNISLVIKELKNRSIENITERNSNRRTSVSQGELHRSADRKSTKSDKRKSTSSVTIKIEEENIELKALVPNELATMFNNMEIASQLRKIHTQKKIDEVKANVSNLNKAFEKKEECDEKHLKELKKHATILCVAGVSATGCVAAFTTLYTSTILAIIISIYRFVQ